MKSSQQTFVESATTAAQKLMKKLKKNGTLKKRSGFLLIDCDLEDLDPGDHDTLLDYIIEGMKRVLESKQLPIYQPSDEVDEKFQFWIRWQRELTEDPGATSEAASTDTVRSSATETVKTDSDRRVWELRRLCRELIQESNKTLEEIGLAMGYDQNTARQRVHRLLNVGLDHDPRLSTVLALAEALETTPVRLFQEIFARESKAQSGKAADKPKRSPLEQDCLPLQEQFAKKVSSLLNKKFAGKQYAQAGTAREVCHEINDTLHHVSLELLCGFCQQPAQLTAIESRTPIQFAWRHQNQTHEGPNTCPTLLIVPSLREPDRL